MFHPAKNAVLRSDLSMGTVVLVAPLAPFVTEPLVRFNLANWLSLAFSGWAFCLLARSWTASMLAGIFAGITAVLGSHQSLHYVHLNLLSVGWLPIFLLALDRVLSGGGRRIRDPGRGVFHPRRGFVGLLRCCGLRAGRGLLHSHPVPGRAPVGCARGGPFRRAPLPVSQRLREPARRGEPGAHEP